MRMFLSDRWNGHAADRCLPSASPRMPQAEIYSPGTQAGGLAVETVDGNPTPPFYGASRNLPRRTSAARSYLALAAAATPLGARGAPSDACSPAPEALELASSPKSILRRPAAGGGVTAARVSGSAAATQPVRRQRSFLLPAPLVGTRGHAAHCSAGNTRRAGPRGRSARAGVRRRRRRRAPSPARASAAHVPIALQHERVSRDHRQPPRSPSQVASAAPRARRLCRGNAGGVGNVRRGGLQGSTPRSWRVLPVPPPLRTPWRARARARGRVGACTGGVTRQVGGRAQDGVV